jgi:signal transduction histidine kinase
VTAPDPIAAPASIDEALARTLRHEVGDFLQKVYASVAILQSRLAPGADMERDVLARLRKRAESCRDLIDHIQDFLCPMELAPVAVNLQDVVAEAATDARHRFPHMELGVDAAEPVAITADPTRLVQVIGFLLNNACESARQRASVAVSKLDSGVTIEVSDDGPGMNREQLGRLFEPFQTTRAGHAGLGLTLARKIVALHNGKITAENRPGGGFRVRVDLPQDPPTHAALG